MTSYSTFLFCTHFIYFPIGEYLLSKQIGQGMIFRKILAQEPGAAKVTKSYFHRLPALKRFYRASKFSLLNSTYLTQNLKTKLRTFPSSSRIYSPIKIRGKLAMGTNEQTNKQKLQLYMYKDTPLFLNQTHLVRRSTVLSQPTRTPTI